MAEKDEPIGQPKIEVEHESEKESQNREEEEDLAFKRAGQHSQHF
jgi:hypothetical protein